MKSEPNLLRRVIRKSGQILLLWWVVSLLVCYLVWQFNPPTYEAVSFLQVQPVTPKLFGPETSDFGEMRGVDAYRRTQAILMTSGRVLKEVLANPSSQETCLIAESKDPEADLRKKIEVEIIDEAFLIRVALQTTTLSTPPGSSTALWTLT